MSVITHNYGFERNQVTGLWRVRCTCGWFLIGEREEVQSRAATHDMEWVADNPVQPAELDALERSR